MAAKRGKNLKTVIIIELVIIILLVIVFLISVLGSGRGNSNPDTTPTPAVSPTPTLSPTPTVPPEPTLTAEELQQKKEEEEHQKRLEAMQPVLDRAEKLAAMYDYDGAITTIKTITDYDKETELVDAIKRYEDAKAACVVWEDNTKISHIFVHSLIVDTDKAFGAGSSQPSGYNKYMTTVDEFREMLEQMYERGFVLVSVHDIAQMTEQEDGTTKLEACEILLPEGKRPFVLSQDDVNYYQYMDGDGFASRLVIGKNGKPTCEYITDEGEVLNGEFDVVPIVDSFLEEHPDFSYRGSKGILAVTGYEGALGYDTGWHMHDLDTEEGKKALAEQQEAATAVADALKEDGWEFASHSYTHTSMTTNSFDKLVYDTDKWKREVQPILGETDIYIYPFGADICDWRGYSGDKYEYLKAAGFVYYCNVDAAEYWVQIRDEYMRMGRINTDGERMYKNPEKLEFLFDVSTVFDKNRPVPVP